MNNAPLHRNLGQVLAVVLCTVMSMGATYAQTTVTFNYTGAAQTWTVPPCVTSINVDVRGAEGGGGAGGGNGARVQATMAVTPGQVLQINVGGLGNCPGGGFNGGGNGQNANSTANRSCGGGGASDIRITPYAMGNRVVVAAGGGGIGGGTQDAAGGNGGCATGTAGTSPFGQGGGGATQATGGTGGPPWIASGQAGTAGSIGQGGNGGNDPCYNNSPGGGGGGGYYGGGGGGSDCFSSAPYGGGSGGGGSSLAAGGSCTAGFQTGNGLVTITYTMNPGTPALFNPVGPYCSGAVIPPLPTTSVDGVVGTWSPAIDNTATTTYNFTPNPGQCGLATTLTIVILPLPISGVASLAPATVCPGQTTTLTLNGQTAGTTIQWQSAPAAGGPWTNIAGATTTPYIYGPVNAPTYFQAVVTDACASVNSNVVNVQFNATPVVNFSATTVCQGVSTQFTDLTAQPATITSWSWIFGDGTPNSNQQNPTHQYAAAGTYNVTLNVTFNNGCIGTVTLPVDVMPNPTADFSSALACADVASALTDLSTVAAPSVINAWQWDILDDGSVEYVTQNANHTFGTGGNYNVNLTVITDAGCTDNVTLPVTAGAIPVAAFTAPSVCVGDPTIFTNQSNVALGNITGWSWIFGDGNMSAVQNPTNTYAAAGNYNVTLTVTTNNGCTDQIMQPVTVINLPTPNFSSTLACEGAATTFTDLTPGVMTTYAWNFDGLGVSPQQNPQFTFINDGTYNVTLTVTAGTGCTGTVTLPVDVMPGPTADFGSNLVCANVGTPLTDLSTVGAPSVINGWQWDILNDGSVEYLTQNPNHTFGIGGIYNVSLTVTTDAGCTHTVTLPVTAAPIPVADFSAPPVCLGATSNFTDQSAVASGAITGWNWDFGDGNVAATQNPTNTYAAAGIYNVTLTVTTDNGCTHTTMEPVIVTDLPTPDFTATQVCQGTPTWFTDLSADLAGIAQWAWDFGGMGASALQAPQFTFAADGTFNVQLTVTSAAGCVNSVTYPVTVNPNPNAAFTSTSVCAQQLTDLTDLSTVNAPSVIMGWAWDFDSNGVPEVMTQNATTTFLTGGSYNVSLGVVTDFGCTSVITLPVVSHPVPVADFSGTSVCEGFQSDFTDLSTVTTGNITGWAWDLAGTPTNQQHPSTTFGGAGIQNISLIVTTDQGCTQTTTGTVEVYDLPIADIIFSDVCYGNVSIFTDNTFVANGSIANWDWDFGNGNVFNGQSPGSQTYPSAGTYTVTLDVTTDHGCVDNAIIQTTIHPIPVPAFTFNNVCEPFATQFTDQSTVGNANTVDQWVWQFGDGLTGNVQNPTHTYGYGEYMVTLTVTSSNHCTATITDGPVTVYPDPVAEFAQDLANCLYDTTQFVSLATVANSPIDQIVSWNWNFGDGSSSVASDTVHHFTAPGFYDVQLAVETANGCQDTVNHTVEIFPIPVAAFAADTNQGCQPFYATFLDQSTLPLPYLIIGWEWDFGDGSSPVSSQYCSHTYDDPNLDALSSGLYDISLTVTSANGCMDDTTVAGYIQTWPKPEALFTVDREVADILDPRFEFTDHSTPNVVQWHWDFGDGVTGDEQNPEHIYQDTISYNIIELVTTDHGCTDTAMYSVEVKPVYTFYMPNCFTPDADAVNATWEPKGTGVKEYHLQIFDRWGERLYESFRLEDQWDGSFKGQQVQNGNYSYIIEVRNVLSEVYHYKGNIRLIR